MEPLLYVMAILGCGEGEAACQEARLAQARYQSQAECVAATEAELPRHEDLRFPVVVAQCRPANAAPQRLNASDFALPDPPRTRLPDRQRFAELPRSSR